MSAQHSSPYLNKQYFDDSAGPDGGGGFVAVSFPGRAPGIAAVTGQQPVTNVGGVAVPAPAPAQPQTQPPAEKHRATARIRSIEFGMLKADEVTRLSHIQVVNKQMYEMGKQIPMQYGPLDKHLGLSSLPLSLCVSLSSSLCVCVCVSVSV